MNSLGRISEKNNGKFKDLFSKTDNEETITHCRKGNAKARATNCTFSIHDMYDPNNQVSIKRTFK